MIYIVEIPHQRPPSAWFAADERGIVDRINAELDRHAMGEQADNFEEAIRINGADLRAQYVLTSDEAMEALRNGGKYWNHHQRERGLEALRLKMVRAGDLEENEIRVQITPTRLFVHWGIHLTTGYPIQPGIDGLYVVCTDTSEAEYLRDHIAPGAELHPFGGTQDARALALADVPT